MTVDWEARHRKIRALLESMDDWVPGPKITSHGDLPGPAPSSQAPCTWCRRRGWVTRKDWGRYPCPVCLGEGWRRRRPDEPEWDRYVGVPLEDLRVTRTGSHDPHQEELRLTASIERIQRVLDEKEGRSDHERFGWERSKAAYDRYGSYKRLRRALIRLHNTFPEAYAAIRRVYVLDVVHLTPHDLALEEEGVRWIAENIGGDVRVPPWVQQQMAVDRREDVHELAGQGWTAGRIARHLKIPKEKVRRILKRRGA